MEMKKESATLEPNLTCVQEDEDSTEVSVSSSTTGHLFSIMSSLSGLGKKKKGTEVTPDTMNSTVTTSTPTRTDAPAVAAMPSTAKRSFMVCILSSYKYLSA